MSTQAFNTSGCPSPATVPPMPPTPAAPRKVYPASRFQHRDGEKDIRDVAVVLFPENTGHGLTIATSGAHMI